MQPSSQTEGFMNHSDYMMHLPHTCSNVTRLRLNKCTNAAFQDSQGFAKSTVCFLGVEQIRLYYSMGKKLENADFNTGGHSARTCLLHKLIPQETFFKFS